MGIIFANTIYYLEFIIIILIYQFAHFIIFNYQNLILKFFNKAT